MQSTHLKNAVYVTESNNEFGLRVFYALHKECETCMEVVKARINIDFTQPPIQWVPGALSLGGKATAA
jgi:hypothetical protein